MILEYESGRIAARLERSERTLVRDVSFSLGEADTLALIGETGSGKTMIALSIMGLLPANVRMSGETIRFLGQPLPLSKKMHALLGVEIVYIPQNGAEFLSPAQKVRRQMYDGLKKTGIRANALEQAALAKLQSAGFSDPRAIIDQYPFQLSGGMAQRVTIALAACSHAKLVIADEPTNGLDHDAKVQFMQMLASLFPKAAKLVITHDIAVARLCRQMIVLCGGAMMERGRSDAVLQSPNHPYTQALVGALVENGMRETPVLRAQSGACPFFRRCPKASAHCTPERVCLGDTEWWCKEIP